MNKKKHVNLIFLLIFFSNIGCVQTDKYETLNGMWEVEFSKRNEPGIKDDYHRDIITFDKGLATVNIEGSFKSFQFEYSLKDNEIVTDTSSFGFIKTLTSDSMVIDHGDKITSYLIPLEIYNPEFTSDDLINILSNSAWHLVYKDSKERIDFSSKIHRDWEGTQTCIRHNYGKYWSFRDRRYWDVHEANTELSFHIGSDDFEWEAFQVKEIHVDSINLVYNGWGYKSHLALVRIPDLNAPIYKDRVTAISSQPWIVDSIDFHNNFDASNEEREWSMPTDSITAQPIRPGTETILKSEFLESNPKYIFNSDGTFHIELPSGSYSRSTWDLTQGGNYILTGEMERPESYIEIIDMSDNKMKIRYILNLRLKPNGRKYVPYDCIITLKN